jgi:hypothetical protein
MARLGGMNARDIRTLLDGKHHPDVVRSLSALAERQDHLFQLLGQLASAMDSLADSLLTQASAVGVLTAEHDRIKQAKAMGVKVVSGAADEE